MLSNKIIIGSANVDSSYGIKKNFIKARDFKNLINYAFKNGVKFIDTSPTYGDSEKTIGLSKKKFSIITKIPKIPKKIKNENIETWIKKIRNSKNKLQGKIIYGLLLQNAEILLSKRGRKIFKIFKKLKSLGHFKKFGVSIYNFKTLEYILDKNMIDFVQLPYNIFDQRFSSKKLIKKIKEKKVEVHARSIFLQGLLSQKNIKCPKKLIKFKETFSTMENMDNKKKYKTFTCLSKLCLTK